MPRHCLCGYIIEPRPCRDQLSLWARNAPQFTLCLRCNLELLITALYSVNQMVTSTVYHQENPGLILCPIYLHPTFDNENKLVISPNSAVSLSTDTDLCWVFPSFALFISPFLNLSSLESGQAKSPQTLFKFISTEGQHWFNVAHLVSFNGKILLMLEIWYKIRKYAAGQALSGKEDNVSSQWSFPITSWSRRAFQLWRVQNVNHGTLF